MTNDAKTHQDIVDGISRLKPQYLANYQAAKAALDLQRDELQQECGKIGHIFGNDRNLAGFYTGRVCLVCGAPEPAPAA